jgi:DNA-binding GntR family transcriptional regulator
MFDALARPVREQIRTGELAPGALLPSESELARAAGTKRYSIRKALFLLRDEGLIEPVPGRGWAVVDPTENVGGVALPRYRQIAAELRGAIETGRLASGAVLPSEAQLIARHGVSRATVRQALALLESDGLISTHPGKGRYVRAR